MKGRLQSSFNFWVETLDAPDFVLDMIRRGYRLPFAEYPSQCFLKNNSVDSVVHSMKILL